MDELLLLAPLLAELLPLLLEVLLLFDPELPLFEPELELDLAILPLLSARTTVETKFRFRARGLTIRKRAVVLLLFHRNE